jgi:hypothetical protein
MDIQWNQVGQYALAIAVTTALIFIILHFSTEGRIWGTFSKDKYKCTMIEILSKDQTPNLTGLFSSSTEAGQYLTKCNSPQAFYHDHNLCTLKDGKYTCYPDPTTTATIASTQHS